MANIKKRNKRIQREFSNYDTSQIEPELGISLDELNRRLNDPSKWKPVDFKRLDELKKISEERRRTNK